eukprot:scaffold607363_cov22-Prasinocladus_malaysianus.AAC.1
MGMQGSQQPKTAKRTWTDLHPGHTCLKYLSFTPQQFLRTPVHQWYLAMHSTRLSKLYAAKNKPRHDYNLGTSCPQY